MAFFFCVRYSGRMDAQKPKFNLQAFAQHAPQALKLLEAEAAKRSLKEFVKQAWPILEPGREMKSGWALDAVIEHLEAVSRGEIKRLVICVPPGSMKSLLTRSFWPAWHWIKQPHARFIGASYALALAERDNTRARTIVTDPWYSDTFKVQISSEQAGKVNFSNTKTGFMMATSVGGVSTGFRGDFFVIDDPLSVPQGDSAVDRATAIRWFTETVPTRLNDLDESAIVVIAQRIHEEDIPGVALERGYEGLVLPMEYEKSRHCTTSIGWSDPRKEEGELMWPERFSRRAVEQMKNPDTGLGPYACAAQLQQSPVPRKGGMFSVDDIELIDDPPQDEDFLSVRSWDLASTKDGGAFTVGVRMLYGKKSGHFFVSDVQRKQASHAQVKEMIETSAEEDGATTMITLPQDPGSAGKAVVQDLIAQLRGFNARAEPQSGSKEDRARPLSAQIENHQVYVLKRVWTKSFLEELRFFPKGKYRDQVDAASSAFNALAPLSRKKTKQLHLQVVGESETNWARKIG